MAKLIINLKIAVDHNGKVEIMQQKRLNKDVLKGIVYNSIAATTLIEYGATDSFARWIDQCCVFGEQHEYPAKALYAHYEQWCSQGNLLKTQGIVRPRVFAARLTRIGLQFKGRGRRRYPLKEGGRDRFRLGIAIKAA